MNICSPSRLPARSARDHWSAVRARGTQRVAAAAPAAAPRAAPAAPAAVQPQHDRARRRHPRHSRADPHSRSVPVARVAVAGATGCVGARLSAPGAGSSSPPAAQAAVSRSRSSDSRGHAPAHAAGETREHSRSPSRKSCATTSRKRFRCAPRTARPRSFCAILLSQPECAAHGASRRCWRIFSEHCDLAKFARWALDRAADGGDARERAQLRPRDSASPNLRETHRSRSGPAPDGRARHCHLCNPRHAMIRFPQPQLLWLLALLPLLALWRGRRGRGGRGRIFRASTSPAQVARETRSRAGRWLRRLCRCSRRRCVIVGARAAAARPQQLDGAGERHRHHARARRLRLDAGARFQGERPARQAASTSSNRSSPSSSTRGPTTASA